MNRIRQFFSQWLIAFARFPLAFILLACITSAVCFIISFHAQGVYEEGEFIRIILACVFALPLVIIPALQSRTTYSTLYSLFFFILGGVRYFSLPVSFESIPQAQQIIIAGSIILARRAPLVYIAFVERNEQTRVWGWRKKYKLSLLLGLVGGGIIRGGLSASLASLQYLFGVDISSTRYQYVGSVAMIFLAGSIWLTYLMHPIEHQEYTRSLRVFGHFIFLPLVSLYGIILISYSLKILITGIRPQGTILYMVAGYIGFSLLTWHITFPALPNRFIENAHTILFVTFLATSFLMIQAIAMRITQYGRTIDRYLVVAGIAGIILCSIGAILLPQKRYIIFMSVPFVLFARSLYGHIRDMQSVSINSQQNRINTILKRYEGVTYPLDSGELREITNEEEKSILQESISYLGKTFPLLSRGETIFTNDIITTAGRETPYTKGDYLITAIGLDAHMDTNAYFDENAYFSFYSFPISKDSFATYTSITPYTKLYIVDTYKSGESITDLSFAHEGQTTIISIINQMDSIYQLIHAREGKEQEVGQEPLILGFPEGKLIITEMSGYKKIATDKTEYHIDHCKGFFLMK